MSIVNLPIDERPREKLISQGAHALSDAELLAIFLRTGVRGKSALDLARLLLNEFGSLKNLFAANFQQFCHMHGLGGAKFAQLHASLEISRRYLQEEILREQCLTNSITTKRYLSMQLKHYSHEVFAAIFLDSCHRMIKFEELFQGSIDNAIVHPRVVVKRALFYNAAAIIFAHNHPSGVTTPSEADKVLTKKLIQILGLIEVRVLDHIIVGEAEAISMAELGMLK